MKPTAINLTSEQYQKLKRESLNTGVSMSGIIRLAIMDYFKEI